MRRGNIELSIDGWGPALLVTPATPIDEVVTFASASPTGRSAVALSSMWAWERRRVRARLRAAGIGVRRFPKSELRTIREHSRLPPLRWWHWALMLPGLVVVTGRRAVGRGDQLLVIEAVAGAPPTAPPDGGDRAPRPTGPSPSTMSTRLPEPS